MNDEICEMCGRTFDRPSFYDGCESKHPKPDKAQITVKLIERNLRDRRGMDWGTIDDEIQQEIRDSLAEIIRKNYE